MKKLILSTVMLIGLAISVKAQEISKNAIGLRIGNNNGFGTEITYQRGLSNSNRIEVDLGWTSNNNYDRFKLIGLYEWIWNIDKGFNWYAGAGGGLGNWSYNFNGTKNNGIFAVLSGDVGVEYVFNFPLQLALDVRPELGINNKAINNNLYLDFALSARYRF